MKSAYWITLALSASMIVGCRPGEGTSSMSQNAAVKVMSQVSTKIEKPNERGYSKISVRSEEEYREGVLDKNHREVIPPLTQLLVDDISDDLALIRFENKFLFVPLQGGPYTQDDFRSVNGFQYARPYSCGVAMVMLNDRWFYINKNGERAFDKEYDFAESFHNDRAIVMEGNVYKILNPQGKIVKELDYQQVNLQSPWCWQVANKVDGKYITGFIDLEGEPITGLIYDNISYYDEETKRIRVYRDKKFGYANEFAKEVIPAQYEYAEAFFVQGKARVVLAGRTLFIDLDGNEVEE